MHIFKYSPRKGTKAAKMEGQIDGKIKEERSQKLIELSNKFEKEYNEKYIGKKIKVLFEEQKNGIYKGHTTNYILAYCNTKQKIENNIFEVKCEKIEEDHIITKI